MKRTPNVKEVDLNKAIAEIKEIATWFEDQKDIDIEKGLEKIKQGAALIKASRARLKSLENTFEEVRKELNEE